MINKKKYDNESSNLLNTKIYIFFLKPLNTKILITHYNNIDYQLYFKHYFHDEY